MLFTITGTDQSGERVEVAVEVTDPDGGRNVDLWLSDPDEVVMPVTVDLDELESQLAYVRGELAVG